VVVPNPGQKAEAGGAPKVGVLVTLTVAVGVGLGRAPLKGMPILESKEPELKARFRTEAPLSCM